MKRCQTLTTTVAETATWTIEGVTGFLESFEYIKAATAPFDNTVDFTLATASGITLFSKANAAASFLAMPRRLETKDTDGTDLATYARMYFSNETLILTVDNTQAASGAAKVGSFCLRFSNANPIG